MRHGKGGVSFPQLFPQQICSLIVIVSLAVAVIRSWISFAVVRRLFVQSSAPFLLPFLHPQTDRRGWKDPNGKTAIVTHYLAAFSFHSAIKVRPAEQGLDSIDFFQFGTFLGLFFELAV